MRYMITALITCLSVQYPALAADKSGNYAIWGKGQKSCFRYLKERTTDKDDSHENYVMGYLTAYNTFTPETYSISRDMSLDDIMAWLDDHCDLNQMHSLEQSLIEFTSRHHEKRLKTPPGRGGR